MPRADRQELTGFGSTYPPGARIAPHAHAAHQLIHAISGSMRVSATDRLWLLPVGRALWLPAHIEHAIDCHGTVGMRTAYLSAAYPDLPCDIRMISVSALAREVLVRLTQPGEKAFKDRLGDVLIHEIRQGSIDAMTLSLPLPGEERIARLAAALRTDPADDSTLADWACRLGYSQRSLIRRIREQCGMSFRELRRQTRVVVATEKLIDGQSVTNVALDVGFETTSAFISAFRQLTGTTPGQFNRTQNSSSATSAW